MQQIQEIDIIYIDLYIYIYLTRNYWQKRSREGEENGFLLGKRIDQKKCVFNQVEDGGIEESIPVEDEEELETKLTMALMTRICISRAGI